MLVPEQNVVHYLELANALMKSGLPWWLSGNESTCQCKETQVRSLGPEDPLEKEMATHSIILAWEIPRDRGAWRATARGVAQSQMQWSAHRETHTQSVIH